MLLVAHIAEVITWSLTSSILGVAPAGADFLYFAFVGYTTVGYGNIVPVERWRLLGPMAAVNGCYCSAGRRQSFSRCCDKPCASMNRRTSSDGSRSVSGPAARAMQPLMSMAQTVNAVSSLIKHRRASPLTIA